MGKMTKTLGFWLVVFLGISLVVAGASAVNVKVNEDEVASSSPSSSSTTSDDNKGEVVSSEAVLKRLDNEKVKLYSAKIMEEIIAKPQVEILIESSSNKIRFLVQHTVLPISAISLQSIDTTSIELYNETQREDELHLAHEITLDSWQLNILKALDNNTAFLIITARENKHIIQIKKEVKRSCGTTRNEDPRKCIRTKQCTWGSDKCIPKRAILLPAEISALKEREQSIMRVVAVRKAAASLAVVKNDKNKKKKK